MYSKQQRGPEMRRAVERVLHQPCTHNNKYLEEGFITDIMHSVMYYHTHLQLPTIELGVVRVCGFCVLQEILQK